ncbi:MAG: carboxypeptidase-like regulatory domain-containing protein [Candidatus Tumulicola sp.]
MKTLTAMLALASFLCLPAIADNMGGGISGYVVDLKTGQAIDHVAITYYRAPYVENNTVIRKLETDRHGYFRDITLEPGRYIVMAQVPGKVLGCAVDDVQTGEISRMKIEIGRDSIVCSGPRVHPTLVDANATADVYRI